MSDEQAIPAPEVETEVPAPSFWSKVPLWVKFAVPAGLVVVLVGVWIAIAANQPTKLEAAAEKCEISALAIGDEGKTLILDMKVDGGSGLPIEDVVCALAELNVSDAVLSQMDSTRALDGKQTAEWDDITATWTYHPDEGLDVILVQK
ncbi:hypothetical protein [Agromyces sp. NBRC 114283]|uniref:hypothetical protein n=1 Tax=Agromyces sp. NBRC 114283 TaxID=2994521 RepID=UPI0024A17637|nr:hypothetical protein [Agromyces sp. NBRC 114283]GLU91365.1 hypothetical protein Agsp01_36200 [Agromyces sp. NBRC 114283]